MDSLEERIVAIIRKNCCYGGLILPTDNLKNDLGMDSLDKMAVIIDIEGKFNVQFVGEEAEKLNTVEDVIDYVRTEIRIQN